MELGKDFHDRVHEKILHPHLKHLNPLLSLGDPRVCLDVKVKSLCLTKHHAMKTYSGSGCIAPRILDLGTRWRSVASFTPKERALCLDVMS
jgi:hypothetical protein